MKIKSTLIAFLSALTLSAITAGEWCPPEEIDTDIDYDCCSVGGGNVTIGYDTDYIFYGVRFARDNVWGDVSYTFDNGALPVTVGVWHLTSLASSGANATSRNFDETDVYAKVGLPSIMGFDAEIGYTHFFFPTDRGPSGTPENGGDSTGELTFKLSRTLGCGFNVFYRAAYDFLAPSNQAGAFPLPQDNDSGAWMHTLGFDTEFNVADGFAIAFSGGVLYSDNYLHRANQIDFGNTRTSGWNSYYLRAAMPISLGCNATLTPYIGYNGTPDTWVADGYTGIGVVNNGGANANDVLHGGVSLSVNF